LFAEAEVPLGVTALRIPLPLLLRFVGVAAAATAAALLKCGVSDLRAELLPEGGAAAVAACVLAAVGDTPLPSDPAPRCRYAKRGLELTSASRSDCACACASRSSSSLRSEICCRLVSLAAVGRNKRAAEEDRPLPLEGAAAAAAGEATGCGTGVVGRNELFRAEDGAFFADIDRAGAAAAAAELAAAVLALGLGIAMRELAGRFTGVAVAASAGAASASAFACAPSSALSLEACILAVCWSTPAGTVAAKGSDEAEEEEGARAATGEAIPLCVSNSIADLLTAFEPCQHAGALPQGCKSTNK
jgi:hypothetical protein